MKYIYLLSTMALLVMAVLFSAACLAPQPRYSISTVPAQGQPTSVQVIPASMWLKVPDTNISNCWLEGPAFDRNGDLYFVDKLQHNIFKVGMADKTLRVFYGNPKWTFNSVKIHKDGRLFICCMFEHTVLVLNPDGSYSEEINLYSDHGPLFPNDMIFNGAGDFYFTAFNKYLPTGGVYRVGADAHKAKIRFDDAIAKRLKDPNGISLSPDGKYLWVGEGDTRVEHRFELAADGKSAINDLQYRIPSAVPGGPDSNQVDSAGNVYQAMSGGGCLAVMSSQDRLIAQVALPADQGRDQYLGTSNVAFQPGTDTGYIVTSGYGGGAVLTFKGLSVGPTLYSHQ